MVGARLGAYVQWKGDHMTLEAEMGLRAKGILEACRGLPCHISMLDSRLLGCRGCKFLCVKPPAW